MIPLSRRIPSERELLELDLEVVAETILQCLLAQPVSQNVSRATLAVELAKGYPDGGKDSTLQAIEEALMWLENNIMIGLSPRDRESIFLTRAGRDRANTNSLVFN